MRLSRIVCASLVSVAIASSAYADALSDARTAYTGAEANQKARLDAAKTFLQGLQTLKNLGTAKLAAYDKDSVDSGDNKLIHDAFKAIEDLDTTNFGENIEVSATYGDKDANKITLTLTKGTAESGSEDRIKLKVEGDSAVSGGAEIQLKSTENTNWDEIFTAEHAPALLSLITEVQKKIDERKKSVSENVESKKLAYAQELGSSDSIADDDSDFVINNESYIQNALNKKISDTNTAVATAQAQKAKEDAAKAAIAAAFEAYKDGSGKTPEEKTAALDAANAAVKATGKTLTGAGTTVSHTDITGDGEDKFVADDFANGRKTIVEGTYTAAFTAAAELEAAKTAVSTAKTAQGNHATALLNVGDNSLVKSYKDKLDPTVMGSDAKNQADKATALKNSQDDQKAKQAAFDEAVKAVDSTKIVIADQNDPVKVKNQVANITAAKAMPETNEAEKIAKLKAAIEAGVIVKSKDGNTVLTSNDLDEHYATGKDKVGDLNNILNTTNTNLNSENNKLTAINTPADNLVTANTNVATKQGELKTANDNLATAKTNYNKAKAVRLNAISENKANNASDKSVLSALSDLTENAKADELASKTDADTVANIAKSVATSADEAKNSLNKGVSVEVLTFNNDLATNTRLAKLSNPFNNELALASAIKNLEYDKFADNGDSISSVVKGYTDRYNYDNNLWGTIIGAKGKIKDSANPEVYGVTIGYDRAFDNTIAGGFLSYAKSDATGSLISNKADNYQIGAYARTFVQNHEIDVKLSLGTAKNTLERKDVVGSYDAKYDTLFTSLDATYGYVIDAGDSLYVKPLVGLGYSYAKNDSFEEKNGALPLKYSAQKTSIITAKLGVDIRKYLENGNYVYVAPSIESELYKSKDKLGITFVGSNKEFVLTANDKKNTFFVLNTGVEAKLTDALSTNVNLGTKLGSKEQYISGSVGLRYKF